MHRHGPWTPRIPKINEFLALTRPALRWLFSSQVLHVPGFFDELDKLAARGVHAEGRLVISDRAHLLFDLHKEVDGLREAELAGTH